jgi:putative exosortase-associated protein (TIGR04073 family)
MGFYLPQSDAAQSINNEGDTISTLQNQAPCSYGQKVSEKGLRVLTNLDFGLLEIPKNIINVTNDSNIFFGFTGGLAKGIIHTLGRMGTGVADLISLPIPTKPIAYPLNPWDDFEQDTRYQAVFQMDNCPFSDAVIATPVTSAIKVRPIVNTLPRPPLDNTSRYKGHTNRKLDKIFKQQMMK